MVSQSTEEQHSAWMVLLGATAVGAVAVLASIFASGLLVSDAATREAELARITSYMYWTQPFIYVMAGLLAGSRDSRWGPVRAPAIGLFLATLCWFALRKQALLPQEESILMPLLTAGALFALGGALIAPLIRRHIGKAVGGIILLGIGAFILAFLNLGAISGVVQRDVITRVEGQATRWETVGVPEAEVALLGAEGNTVLYTTKTNNGGRYHINGVPIGDYTLQVSDPAGPAVLTEEVTVERSITGGTRWKTMALPTHTEDTGPLFE